MSLLDLHLAYGTLLHNGAGYICGRNRKLGVWQWWKWTPRGYQMTGSQLRRPRGFDVSAIKGEIK
ncbi:MAG: hypothetical protein WC390_10355 [Sulfurimonas sp.]|jgi:hypothetical protein